MYGTPGIVVLAAVQLQVELCVGFVLIDLICLQNRTITRTRMAAGKSGSKSGAKAGSRSKAAKVVKSPQDSQKLQVVDENLQVLKFSLSYLHQGRTKTDHFDSYVCGT